MVIDMVRVIDILVKNLREFKYGKAPTVYLPFIGFLRHGYIERYLARVVGGDAEGVYAKLTKLLNEIVSDPEYSVTTTVRRCETMDDCLRRFLITREALFSIARAIRRYGAIPNSISIIRRECSVRPCGTVLSTAKTYDALLLIYGVAYSPIKMRCQILLSTPFTHTFMNVLLNAIAPEKYIDALRNFIECVVTVYPEPIENAVQYCQETLNKWRVIGVEDCNVDSIVDTLYRLIEQLLTY
jgi:hypothetical protein